MEHDLKKLAGLKIPATGEKAKDAAVLAAIVAFDNAVDEKNAGATQGSTNGVRPTSIVNKLWSTIMNSAIKPVWTMKPATMATLATVMLMPVGGLVAWEVYKDGRTEGIVSPLEARVEDRTKLANKIEQLVDRRDTQPQEIKPDRDLAINQTPNVTKQPQSAGSEAGADSQSIAKPQASSRKLEQFLRREEKRRGLAEGNLKPLPYSGVKLSTQTDRRPAPAKKPNLQQRRLYSSLPKKAEMMRNRLMEATRASKDLARSGTIAPQPIPAPETNRERYTEFDDNSAKVVAQHPVSTFSIDVDTASYSRVRRALMSGNLPAKDMVRIEELINYFNYDLKTPEDRAQPFKPSVKITQNPWNPATQLLHVGIKGFDVPRTEQPKANLVVLLDVSGSMNQPDKLPLLIKSFGLLLQKLNPDDTVSIVTYAGRAGTVLEPTKASDKTAIMDALNNLRAGGSTGGAQGIEQAYKLAKKSFVEGGVNRVMLATDGDFNVGISDPKQLKDFIAKKRKEGVFLSVFGFGRGNYNDALMQSLAQNGNGQAAYIDTLAEAQKSLVEEAGSTLFPIAKDVKIQIEFDPAKIAEYRLIGYETRALKREDFNNDKVDAGDIGAGHSISAIYELVPAGSSAVSSDPLRYSAEKTKIADNPYGEVGFLKMRYKLPNESKSRLISEPIINPDNRTVKLSYDGAFPPELRFATAVAAFGQKLRGNVAVDDMKYEDIADLAANARGEDKFGYRSAFVQLVRMAGSLSGNK